MNATSRRDEASAALATPSLVGSRIWLAYQRLGGRQLLGVDVRSEADFIRVIECGMSVAALAELARQEGLAPEEIDRLIIPRRTLSHRKARHQPLNRIESERAIRVASIAALAEETFASKAKAQLWLRRSTAALDGRRPLDLLDSEPGARTVEQLLYRIAHGIAA